MFFLIRHSGRHFSTFWRVLIPRQLILGTPWRPAGYQMTPKITQVVPKACKKVSGWITFWGSSNRLAPKIVFGALFGTILMDFWWILHIFWRIYYGIPNACRTHVCNKICRLPTSPDTKRIDSKHQEYTDMCRGPHVPSTSHLRWFKLSSTSQAYWRADSKRESLTRIYGMCYPDKSGLQERMRQLEEAAKRDHKKIDWSYRLKKFSCGTGWLLSGFPFIPLELIHLEQDTPAIYPLSTINRLPIMSCWRTTYRLTSSRCNHTDQPEDYHECLSRCTP